MNDSVQGQLLPARKLLQARGDFSAQLQVLGGEAVKAVSFGRTSAIRERRGRGEAGELRAPVAFGLRQSLLCEPGEVVAIRPRGRQRSFTIVIKSEQLLQQQRHGPAVKQQVMIAPHEVVKLFREL